jgi:hypothetical protein
MASIPDSPMTVPHGYLRIGSVSLGSARKAARAAKAETPERAKDKASPAALERYLGHFGSSVRKSGAKKSTGHALSTKKANAKKTGARKPVRAYAGKKTTARKASARKASTKKASAASRKR